jgi:2-polyprenyl-3-methyl-5-hydroxy-6-metoxy-1,4-benzoquinol methylase
MHCPLCSATDVEIYSDAPQQDLTSAAMGSSRREVGCGEVLRCRQCRLGFRASRADEQELARLYADLDIEVYQSEVRGRLATARRHLGIIRRYSRPSRLLDIGCASGMFLRRAADEGWSVVGVEPSRQLSELARKNLDGRGEIISTTLQGAGLTRADFDVVTMWDVLEHVPEPAEFLQSAVNLLRPGGHLFVNVPDLDSLQARLLGTRWPLLLPEHLNYFNRSSLAYCGAQAGLVAVHMGRRKASFSVEYILYRLRQHGVIGASAMSRFAGKLGISRIVMPVSLGELYVVWTPKAA